MKSRSSTTYELQRNITSYIFCLQANVIFLQACSKPCFFILEVENKSILLLEYSFLFHFCFLIYSRIVFYLYEYLSHNSNPTSKTIQQIFHSQLQS